MPELVDDVLELLSPYPSANALAREIGFDSAISASTAAQLAVPLIVAGMVHRLNDPDGSDGLIDLVRTVDTAGLHDFGSTLTDRSYEPAGSEAIRRILGPEYRTIAAKLAPQAECVESSAVEVFPPMAWAVTGLIAKRNGREHNRHSLLQIVRNEHDGLLRTGWGEWMAAVTPEQPSSPASQAAETAANGAAPEVRLSSGGASEVQLPGAPGINGNGVTERPPAEDRATLYPPPIRADSRSENGHVAPEPDAATGTAAGLDLDGGPDVAMDVSADPNGSILDAKPTADVVADVNLNGAGVESTTPAADQIESELVDEAFTKTQELHEPILPTEGREPLPGQPPYPGQPPLPDGPPTVAPTSTEPAGRTTDGVDGVGPEDGIQAESPSKTPLLDELEARGAPDEPETPVQRTSIAPPRHTYGSRKDPVPRVPPELQTEKPPEPGAGDGPEPPVEDSAAVAGPVDPVDSAVEAGAGPPDIESPTAVPKPEPTLEVPAAPDAGREDAASPEPAERPAIGATAPYQTAANTVRTTNDASSNGVGYQERQIGGKSGGWAVAAIGAVLMAGAVLWFLAEDQIGSTIGQADTATSETTAATTVDQSAAPATDEAAPAEAAVPEAMSFDVTLADPTGATTATATASLQLDPAEQEICYDIQADGLGDSLQAQMNNGVIPDANLVADLGTVSDSAVGCAPMDEATLQAILTSPSAHYLSLSEVSDGQSVWGRLGP